MNMTTIKDMAKPGEKRVNLNQVLQMRQGERQKLKQLVRQRRETERIMLEHLNVRATLKELGEKGKVESLIPLGGGILIEGTITSTAFKRTLPGNVIVNANKKQVEADLDERQKIIEEEMKFLDSRIQDTSINLQSLDTMVEISKEALAQKKQKKK
jgi:prefoldin subunit 5